MIYGFITILYIDVYIQIYKVMCTTGAFYECEEEWENHWAEQKLKKEKKV